jgi:hypothetical protein
MAAVAAEGNLSAARIFQLPVQPRRKLCRIDPASAADVDSFFDLPRCEMR